MGRETLGKVQDESRDPSGGPGRVGGPSERSKTGRGTSRRSGTGRRTLQEFQEGLRDPHRDPRWVGLTS